MSEKTIYTLLSNLGFTKKESEVYLAIQRQGKVSPADLAEATGINRTTIYSVAKELLSKGVIVEDLGSSKRELLAKDPEELKKVFQIKINELKQKQSAADQVAVQIKELAGDAFYPVPKIQLIKEDQIESFLYERTAAWNKSLLKTDSLYLGFQEQAFVDQYVEWIDWYWKNAPKKIHLRLLSNDSTAEKKAASLGHERREIIFWKDGVTFTATTWVMGDYVVMFVLSSSPHYLVEIHDARFAENQRAIFNGILEDIN
jgi:sugar-specific transcriptional regulator TrmB